MTQTRTAQEFPCHTCGGDLHFDPASGGLLCPHCGAKAPIQTGPWETRSALRELSFDKALKTLHAQEDDTHSAISDCASCGAQLHFTDDVSAKICPYCTSPIVRKSHQVSHLQPKALIPFAVTQEEARAVIENWLSARWFLPNKLRSFARHAEKIKGVYAPYWTYDADTETQYNGRRGDAYYVTRTRTVNGKQQTYQERRIRWSPRSGRVRRMFDDVMCVATRHLPRKLLGALHHWDLSALTAYNSAYMAGFTSELYSRDVAECYDEACMLMEQIIQSDIRLHIGGDEQAIEHYDVDYKTVTYKHILLPVWVAAYRYGGQTYEVMVNGQTQEIVGDRPYSVVKIALTLLVIGVVLGGLAYLGYENGWFSS